MLTIKAAIVSTALSLCAFSAGAVTVTPGDAMSQVGHAAKVCGVVASANYAADARAHPTFLGSTKSNRGAYRSDLWNRSDKVWQSRGDVAGTARLRDRVH